MYMLSKLEKEKFFKKDDSSFNLGTFENETHEEIKYSKYNDL